MKFLDPSWWIAAWNRFWFARGSPRNLAAARIIFAAYSLWVLLSRNLAEMSGLPSVFWSQVGASARWRYLVFPRSEEHTSELQSRGHLVCRLLLEKKKKKYKPQKQKH